MKTIKIHKKYHGDEFIFEVKFSPKSMICSVRQLCTDKIFSAHLHSDFKTICLNEPFWIEGINGDFGKEILYLTINKWKVNDVKEYVCN